MVFLHLSCLSLPDTLSRHPERSGILPESDGLAIPDASLPYVKAVWWFPSRIPLERVASELGSFECLRPNNLPAPALLPLVPLEAAKFKFIDWINEHQLDVEKAQIFAILGNH